MAKDYSEDQLIQRSTAELLEKELGWKSVYAFDNEVLGEQGTLDTWTQDTGRGCADTPSSPGIETSESMDDRQAVDRSYRAHDQLHELADADADTKDRTTSGDIFIFVIAQRLVPISFTLAPIKYTSSSTIKKRSWDLWDNCMNVTGQDNH